MIISNINGCSIIILISSIICLILTALLVVIHLRQPLLKVGFFNVVLGTIFFELFMHLMLIVNSIFNIVLDKEKDYKMVIISLAFVNDFLFSTHISYNCIIISSFINKSKIKEPLIEKDLDNSTSDSRQTLKLKKQSFNHIHIISIVLGAIHPLVSFLTESLGSFIIPFCYISIEKVNYYVLLLFIYHYIYFIMSIWYCIVSWDKFKISTHIRLKNYSWYCLFTSFLWLNIPACYMVAIFKINIHNTVWIYVSTSLFVLLMISNTFFHFKCYYISYLIKTKGFNVFSTICYGLKLLFCIEEVPELNFVDFNSTYIFHSLSTANDLMKSEIQQED